ncbi:ATP-binding cassette domain-containing protein [Thermodesulfobacteriota bacterium B35]
MFEAHILKKRERFTVDVRLCCPAGELLVLTGPSGSGKTTVIRTLAGLERPDAGYIRYRERYWFSTEERILLKPRQRRVGYVFQEHTLFPHLTVAKNIAYGCRDPRRVDELLSMLHIRHLARSRPHEISGGERQRAALAQALATDPQVLLLDEPFSALDGGTRALLRAELKRLQNRLRLPVIMVTHDADEARQLGDRHIHLCRGAATEPAPREDGLSLLPAASSLPV